MYYKNKFLIFLLAGVIFLAVAQITLGGVVRVTGSGDACPNWPTCFDSLIPPLNNWRVGLEWGHRTLGVLLGLWSILVVLYTVITYKRRKFVALATVINLILITITGVIGGTVVLSELNPILRTLHLILAQFVILVAVVALIVEVRPQLVHKKHFKPKMGTILSIIVMIAVLVIIVSGSYAVWRGVGLVCMSWPVCNFSDGFLPNSELEWINTIHRILTALMTLIILYGAYYIMRRSSSGIKLAAIAILVAIIVEVLLGAAVASTIRIGTTNTELLWLLNAWRGLHIGFSSVVWVCACLMAVGWLVSNSKWARHSDNAVHTDIN